MPKLSWAPLPPKALNLHRRPFPQGPRAFLNGPLKSVKSSTLTSAAASGSPRPAAEPQFGCAVHWRHTGVLVAIMLGVRGVCGI